MHSSDILTHAGLARRAICVAGATAFLSAMSSDGFAAPSHETASSPSAASVRGKRVYIIHGYMAAPSDHWFPWLQRRLSAEGVEADVLSMPEPGRPDPVAWGDYLDAHVVRPDEDTFFVAHSLGCIALLHHLARVQASRIGGIVLVSGFDAPLPGLPQLDGFVASPARLDRIKDLAPCRSVIAARDDTIVPYVLTRHLAEHIGAEFITVEKGGHFLASDGFVEFPLVYQTLMSHMRSGSR
ncbi:hypothetical protein SAMN05428966_102166 [Massilia sp. PDC64]|nr:alpha/beta hydrolase [Massilia sp. PDC64]SDC71070.1 hypothetical protein SAMN05428966_102166 [Massilia sp. PDC64]